MPGDERADVAPVNRASTGVAPVTGNRIRLIKAAPVDRIEVVMREEGAVVRGGCPHPIEFGQRDIATSEKRLMAGPQGAERHFAGDQQLTHVRLDQCTMFA